MIILRERQQVLMLWFGKKALERKFYALFSNIKARPIRDRPTPKDDERFRNGSVYEFYSLKAQKTLKEVNSCTPLKYPRYKNNLTSLSEI